MRSFPFFLTLIVLYLVPMAGILVLTSGGGTAKNTLRGTLLLNKSKVPLTHVYVDEAVPDEPMIVLSDQPLTADAIPFPPEKLVKDKKVHAVSFTVSLKEKKLSTKFGAFYHPEGDMFFTGLGEGEVVLRIQKLDSRGLEAKIMTVKPIVFSGLTYSFEASFQVGLGADAEKPPLPEISVTGDSSPPAKAFAHYYRLCLEGEIAKLLGCIASESRKQLESMDQPTREMALEVLKMKPAKIKIGKPIVTGQTASFKVEGFPSTGEKATGSVKMVLEDGTWKILEDKWAYESK